MKKPKGWKDYLSDWGFTIKEFNELSRNQKWALKKLIEKANKIN
jgi:hypothetical protein|tara:strand:+ start:109 stop:240 length:132 start_codon:yes stop_codon:yes gene_type:complete